MEQSRGSPAVSVRFGFDKKMCSRNGNLGKQWAGPWFLFQKAPLAIL